MICFYTIIFLGGTCLGSLYHVIGYHMPIQKVWISNRSCCPQCLNQLKPHHLIPIVSYIIQKGRCRYCYGKFKVIYLLIEMITGILFIFPVWFYGFVGFQTGQIYIAWTFLSMLVIITVSDIYYQLILDKVLLFFGVILFFLYGMYPMYHLFSGIVGAGVGFFMLYGIGLLGKILFKKETLGGGDIKLYTVIGFLLGISNTFLSLMLSSILALIYLLLFMKDKTKPLAFGPFIAFSSYFCLFYGETLLNEYYQLF
ncbi:MAG: prepilin peptidase [Turicibacter sp.]|nr:prepilin peptidase [Turicibacter sp.]